MDKINTLFTYLLYFSPLVWLGLSIFERFNVCQTLNCSESTARQWLSVIESNYRNHNPYHNSTHAADVAQATAYFLMSKRLSTIFDPLDQAICLIAAIIHDIDHPGRNSSFLANSNHDLALLYNDMFVNSINFVSMPPLTLTFGIFCFG